MKNKSVLFLGALSDIAKSTIQKFGEMDMICNLRLEILTTLKNCLQI